MRRLIDEIGVDHIDLNFGCPAAKVTRQGAGAALPVRPGLFRAIVAAAVGAAGSVPVTVKLRIGVDDDQVTFLDAGRIAEDEGVAAVTLHARTAEQLYSGRADWDAIGRAQSAPDLHPGPRERRSVGGVRRVGHGGCHRLRRGGGRPGLSGSALAVPRPGRRLRRTTRADPTRPGRDRRDDARPTSGSSATRSERIWAFDSSASTQAGIWPATRSGRRSVDRSSQTSSPERGRRSPRRAGSHPALPS